MFARNLLRSAKTLEGLSTCDFSDLLLTECLIHITLIGTAALFTVLNYIGFANGHVNIVNCFLTGGGDHGLMAD